MVFIEYNIHQFNRFFVEVQSTTKWYTNIRQRVGIWKHLTNPLYILVVLYLSILLMPSILLSVTWYPWVYYINHNDKTISKLNSKRSFILPL